MGRAIATHGFGRSDAGARSRVFALALSGGMLCLAAAIGLRLLVGIKPDTTAQLILAGNAPMVEGEAFIPLGECQTPGRPRDALIFGQTVVVALNYDGMCWIDIADPARPRLTAHRRDARPIQFRRVGDRVYAAEPNDGVSVWDFTDPQAPERLAFLKAPGRPTGLVVRNGAVFVACGGAGMAVLRYDPSSGLSPVSCFALSIDYTKDIDLLGDTALLADNLDGGVKAVDIADPSSPKAMWNATSAHCFFDQITIVDRLIYAATRIQVSIIDVDRPHDEKLIGVLWRGEEGKVTATVRRGDGLFVLRDSAGVDIYDISSPAVPRFIGHSALATGVSSLTFVGDLIIATCHDTRIRLFKPHPLIAQIMAKDED